MKALAELPAIEKSVVDLVKQGKNDEAKKYVTLYTDGFAYSAMKKWEELKVTLWGMYGRGF
jgi:hypothetical protein